MSLLSPETNMVCRLGYAVDRVVGRWVKIWIRCQMRSDQSGRYSLMVGVVWASGGLRIGLQVLQYQQESDWAWCPEIVTQDRWKGWLLHFEHWIVFFLLKPD